jgi:hypothetical protein
LYIHRTLFAVLEVLQESDDFTEIGDLLKRHETLKVLPSPRGRTHNTSFDTFP